MPISARDDSTLAAGVAAWSAALDPEAPPARVQRIERPSAGWSNDTVLLTVERGAGPPDEVVLRLPPTVASFPDYDLSVQAAVQEALVRGGVPAPRPLLLEADPRWLGAPFLVMERVAGRPAGEVPALDPWITGARPEEQRRLHEGFVDVLAAVHRLDWQGAGLGPVLRGADGDLGAAVAWWKEYVEWAADGEPAPTLRRLVGWCAENVPGPAGPVGLCWGDPRLGNVLYDEGRRVAAVLDWDLAVLGPPEADLAWYLALDRLTTEMVGATVPGFLDREELLARYQGRLGRPVADLDWHEIFALVRAAAVNDRQARVAARLGLAYPGVAGEDNPVLGWISRRLAELG